MNKCTEEMMLAGMDLHPNADFIILNAKGKEVKLFHSLNSKTVSFKLPLTALVWYDGRKNRVGEIITFNSVKRLEPYSEFIKLPL